MKTIVTLDKANQPFGFPQLNAQGHFDNIITNAFTGNSVVIARVLNVSQSQEDTKLLSIDDNGFLHFKTGSTAGDYLPLSGGTETGGTVFTSGLTATTTTGTSLTVIGSGNTNSAPLFTVYGLDSNAELFSVVDTLTGTLFSVNNISGLPIFEVLSDSRVFIGESSAPSLYTTKRLTNVTTTTTVYTFPVSAYTSAFIDYFVSGTTGLRAGNIMSVWDGATIKSTEVSTSDIGSTSAVTFTWSVSGTDILFRASPSSDTWNLKTILRGL